MLRKTIQSLIFLLGAIQMVAQENAATAYQSKLEELIKTYSINPCIPIYEVRIGTAVRYQNYSSRFNDIIASINLPEGTDCSEGQYMREQFYNDLTQIMLPYFQKELSIEELDALLDLAKDEKLKAAVRNIHNATDYIYSMQCYEVHDKTYDSKNWKVIKEEETITINLFFKINMAECSKPYKQKVNKYWKLSKNDKRIEAIYPTSTAKEAMQKFYTIGYMNVAKNFEDKITTRITGNIKNFTLNKIIESASEEDLDLYIEMLNAPIGKKMNKAFIAYAEQPKEIQQKLQEKFMEWVAKKASEQQ